MLSTPSYQLPDLRSFIEPHFDLRVNPRCKAASVASQSWLLATPNLLVNSSSSTPRRRVRHELTLGQSQKAALLKSSNVGLLAATSFPTCDQAQLRLVTDFLSLLIVGEGRCLLDSEDFDDPHLSHILQRLSLSPPSESWAERFVDSLSQFRLARTQFGEDARHSVVPDLESYIELRRYESGSSMVFDLIEWSEGLILSEDLMEDPVFVEMKTNALDLVAWCMDLFSYNTSQSKGKSHNLITILMTTHNLTLQSAISLASQLIQDTLHSFLHNSSILLEPLSRSHTSTPLPTHSSLTSSFFPPISYPHSPSSDCSSSSPDSEARSFMIAPDSPNGGFGLDVELYVQGLKDFVCGFVHWAFESEWYFGEGVDDVREYGWVFLKERVKGTALDTVEE
ncbi:hypothetical protein JAAARDRAFT_42584 [Jaapia argillacea MUCL 33604]|uniref:Terpene synthase n=1 Tax=Jaapia argillacea MUCL 33604 TaxID=933084 RepID=A0A067PFE6_9AGAM|nr:hypothetical protein JAAARDRAFT_42584 [Jaapia argillacea MUCL 33604]